MEGVYFQAVPANFSRFLTDEERAEFRRRTDRRWDSYVLYWLLPAISLVALLAADWNGLLTKGSFSGLFFAWLCLTAVAVLMLRNALNETRILRTIGPDSRIVGFSGYKLQASSLLEFLAPPSSIEVVYPQGLVIRADSRLKRVFGRIELTRTEEVPWPTIGDERRELTELEVEELGRQLDRYSKIAWKGFAFVACFFLGFKTLSYSASTRISPLGEFADDMFSIVRQICWIAMLLFGLYELWRGTKHFGRIKRAREAREVTVAWDGDEFEELLLPERVPWRSNYGPAPWRRNG